MLKAIDVANFFVDLANSDPDDCMTNLRVNKLLYFAQAWSVVRRNKPLFEEDMQAWKYGPVVPEVYTAFSACGRERIASVSGDYSLNSFSSDELDLLIDVARQYGNYTSSTLVDFTHEKNGPWDKVYVEGQKNIISKESLKTYFSQQNTLKSFSLPEAMESYVGYRDSADGLLILPKEYDDESE